MSSGKKGWIRIVEACLAIIIIVGVLAFMFNKNMMLQTKEAEAIEELQLALLEEIGRNQSLRGYVIEENKDKLEKFLSSRLKDFPKIGWKVEICQLNNALCHPDDLPENKDVYVHDRIIYKDDKVKIVRLFFWKK